MSSFQRNGRLVLLAVAGVLLTCLHGPVVAGNLQGPLPRPGVIVANTVLSDNGDDDGFADTNETVEMRLTVRNMTGGDLTRLVLLLETDDPRIECITVPMIEIGSLLAGEFLLTERFVFKVAEVNRVSVDEAFSVTFDLIVATPQNADLAIVPTITLDLDLDVSGGSGPTTYFEGFESSDLGSFTTMHLDAGHGGSATDGYDNPNSEGFRCQYSNPTCGGSTCYGAARDCYLNPTGHPDAYYWQTTSDRALSGTGSLYFGIPLSPELGFTTPLAQLEAVRTTEPINLAWDRICSVTREQACSNDDQCPAGEACVQATPQLSFKHQISLMDFRTVNARPGRSADRGAVHVQLADSAGTAIGDWIKLDPVKHTYDQQVEDNYTNCFFDPTDDGNDEDSFFDPSDPERRLGPSSTCFPEFSFVWQGDTGEPFSEDNLGFPTMDGPGLEGATGLGTWVEPIFNLSRFRGRRLRLRFLETGIKGGSGSNYESVFFPYNPDPGDDGWWIDDVQITNTLTNPAIVSVDTKDNSLLPGLTDDDGDGVLCDTCPMTANPGQVDSDGDLIGDACDPCPLEFVNDQDDDGLCCPEDNCCATSNASQLDQDNDTVGDVCDNCLADVNAGQEDRDLDGLGDTCDACPDDRFNDFDDDGLCGDVDNCGFVANLDQANADGDLHGDVCDNCPAVPNDIQYDTDDDSFGDACDNCPADHNPQQLDLGSDGEGDLCDLDDGLIYISVSEPDIVGWQDEVTFVAFNSYRGDLGVLKSTGIYTQSVGSNPLAAQVCGLTDPFVQDLVMPAPGAAAFYLTTGVTGTGIERPLGPDSSGTRRPNSNPCP